MLNKKHLYNSILLISLFFGIFFNKGILKKFTIDNEINDFNLAFLSNFLSIFFLLIFLIFLIFFNKKEKIISFFIEKKREFLICFISIFFSIVFIEIFLNFFNSSKLKNTVINAEAIEFKAEYIYNNFGYRDDDFKKNKDNEYRVFFIGDSFVHGSAVNTPYTFDKIIENKLKNNKKNINIYNLGIPGANISNYLKTLIQFKKFKPDSIYIFLYLDNDIIGDNKIKQLSSSLSYFLEKSEIINLIKQYMDKKFYISDEYLNKFNLSEKMKKSFQEELLNVHQLALLFKGNYHSHYNNLQDLFNNSNDDKKRILEIKEISDEIKAKLYFVIIPSKYQVKTKYQNFPKKEFGMKFNKGIINDNLQIDVIKWLETNQILTIDLLPYLRESKNLNYYIIDDHFNKDGNKLTSNIILEYIVKDIN